MNHYTNTTLTTGEYKREKVQKVQNWHGSSNWSFYFVVLQTAKGWSSANHKRVCRHVREANSAHFLWLQWHLFFSKHWSLTFSTSLLNHWGSIWLPIMCIEQISFLFNMSQCLGGVLPMLYKPIPASLLLMEMSGLLCCPVVVRNRPLLQTNPPVMMVYPIKAWFITESLMLTQAIFKA